MGKIKSARELALERAAALTAGIERETKPFEHEQYIKAAARLAAAYLESKINLERLSETIANYPPEAAPAARDVLLKGLTAGLGLNNCEQVWEAFRNLKPGCKDLAAVEALRVLHHDYLDRLANLRSGLEQDGGLGFLKEQGISGSAIAGINLDRSPQWQELQKSLEAELSGNLQQLKQQLAEQL